MSGDGDDDTGGGGGGGGSWDCSGWNEIRE